MKKCNRKFNCKNGVLLYVELDPDFKYDNCVTLTFEDSNIDFTLIDITFNLYRGIKPKHVLSYCLTATTPEKLLEVLNTVDTNIPPIEAMEHINMSTEIIKEMSRFQSSLYSAIARLHLFIR